MGTQVHSDPSYSTFQAVYTAAPGLENIQEGASLCVRAGEGCGELMLPFPSLREAPGPRMDPPASCNGGRLTGHSVPVRSQAQETQQSRQ